MDINIKSLFAEKVRDYHLPAYHELPDMGLYLDQVTKYVNGYLVPLGCGEMTPSMVSNYVKKGVIAPPVRKLYYAEQIAYLLFIGVGKSVLSLENIASLFVMQRASYDAPTAYNYFRAEFLNMLRYIAGLQDTVDDIGVTSTETKSLLRSVIIAASHILFAGCSFAAIKAAEEK